MILRPIARATCSASVPGVWNGFPASVSCRCFQGRASGGRRVVAGAPDILGDLEIGYGKFCCTQRCSFEALYEH